MSADPTKEKESLFEELGVIPQTGGSSHHTTAEVEDIDLKAIRASDDYFTNILALAGETIPELGVTLTVDGESNDARGTKRDNGGENSYPFLRKRHKPQENSSSIKTRTPVSYMGDEFIQRIHVKRHEIRSAVTNTQMLLYLLWRNLYWTRFYGPAAHANSPIVGQFNGTVGLVVPVKRLVDYLEMMYIKVEPFLSKTPPSKQWIIKSLLGMTRGAQRTLLLHPVVHNVAGTLLDETDTDLFESKIGITFIDKVFCQRMERALVGDTAYTKMPLMRCPSGIAFLHRKWLLAQLDSVLK